MGGDRIESADLKQELENRFLWYAISTIASRALPDVRDGLKPVHRRILYAMYRMRLTPDARYRKSAAVVGDVLGKYHPHGDQAAYDTMVRLAQEFSLRYPLVDGQGNFGSIDGDSAAAMRYTEARLTPIALELLKEIDQETVPFRPNYDNTIVEPVYLPSRVPNILINGSSGIAVGMATNIPPHNLDEVVNAITAMIDDPSLGTVGILKYIKGPDFPTGATLLTSKKELRQIYDEGKGSIKVRGEWNVETLKRGRKQIVITSLPYTVNKAKLIEKIAQIIIAKKMTALDDVRDESDEKIRVVVELKGDADISKIMAYLFKYTDIEQSFALNMTALDPSNTPRRMSIAQVLKIFLDFRIETTVKRLEFELRKITERLHILHALLKVLKSLDEAIAIIRKAKSRDEAKTALKKRFKIDDIQVNAVLDLRLSSLVSLEVKRIKEETAELEAKEKEITGILKSKKKIRSLVKKELKEVKDIYGDKRKTKLVTAEPEEEYSESDFITHEECFVIISRNGWVRRAKNEPTLKQLRFKEGDSLLKIFKMDTSQHIAFFSSAGKVYITTAFKLQQTAGYGDPVQALFKFSDGETIVFADYLPFISDGSKGEGEYLVVTENGLGFRFNRNSLDETSKAGKRFASLKNGNTVQEVMQVDKPLLYVAGSGGKGLLMKLSEVSLLSGVGAGVKLIKLKDGERIIAVKNVSKKGKIRLLFDSGRDSIFKIAEMEVGTRATTGRSYGGLKKKLMAVVDE